MTRRVEFSETDMAGIVHFSNFFRYMETVEHGFYRSLGHSVILPGHQPPVGLPRVHASCDYRRPLRYEDVVEMHLVVKEKRARSVVYRIRFRKVEPGEPVEVALGTLIVASVRRLPDGSLEAVPLPVEMFDRIEPAPPEMLASMG